MTIKVRDQRERKYPVGDAMHMAKIKKGISLEDQVVKKGQYTLGIKNRLWNEKLRESMQPTQEERRGIIKTLVL